VIEPPIAIARDPQAALERFKTRTAPTIPVERTDSAQAPRPASVTVVRPRRFRSLRIAISGIAAAAAVSFFAFTPSGQTVAAQFLAQFRGQKLAVITFDAADAKGQLPELNSLGSVRGDSRMRPDRVSSLLEASARAGFATKQIDPTALPDFISLNPEIAVSQPKELRYVLESAKANQYLASNGHPERTLPAKLDGATVVVAVPSAVVTQYSSKRDQDMGLVFAQTGELAIGVEGAASLDEVRDFILSLPNLSEATARQLRSIQDWRNTLPIPIPVDKVTWHDTTVLGAPGFMFSEPSGLGSALIWNQSGQTFGLAGGLSAADLQRAASGIR
jgi:hypothetical protein